LPPNRSQLQPGRCLKLVFALPNPTLCPGIPELRLGTMRRPRNIVSFDATCGLCRSSVSWLRRLDWLRRFEFVPIADLPRAADGRNLPSPEQLDRALHVFAPDSAVLSGARALRFMGLRMPLLALPALLLFLPFALGWAERGYGWVSTRRHALSGRVPCQSANCTAQTPIKTSSRPPERPRAEPGARCRTEMD
jgi:predicted DCC family thiol-disulfide oxidoreductase YuxK